MTTTNTLWVSIPLPPTTNNAYPTNTKTGRRFLSKVGKAFKEQAGWNVRAACIAFGELPTTDRYSLSFHLYFGPARKGQRRDASNRIKLAEDAVMEALGVDDSRVVELHVYIKNENATDPHCLVRIEALDGKDGTL